MAKFHRYSAAQFQGASPLIYCGEVAEWLMAPAWKACLR
jgi:hypothetical protein